MSNHRATATVTYSGKTYNQEHPNLEHALRHHHCPDYAPGELTLNWPRRRTLEWWELCQTNKHWGEPGACLIC